jgi:hypothetical protein
LGNLQSGGRAENTSGDFVQREFLNSAPHGTFHEGLRLRMEKDNANFIEEEMTSAIGAVLNAISKS